MVGSRILLLPCTPDGCIPWTGRKYKKHVQGEENWWARTMNRERTDRLRPRWGGRRTQKVGRWREEEIRVLGLGIRVLRREEDRRRETLSTHSTKCNHTKVESVTESIRDKFMKPPSTHITSIYDWGWDQWDLQRASHIFISTSAPIVNFLPMYAKLHWDVFLHFSIQRAWMNELQKLHYCSTSPIWALRLSK